MPDHFVLVCADCGQVSAALPSTAFNCPHCHSEWLEARYDYAALGPKLLLGAGGRWRGLWRYRELLPVRDPENVVTLGEGGTPLIRATNLGLMLGRPNIFIKDERQGPTGSFKDRQAALAVSVMKENGLTQAVVASTGNVAIAYAAYCARAGIKLYAFLTSLVPGEKMRECALYGAQVVKVTATYDRAKDLAAQFAAQRGMYFDRGLRSIAAVESMKTMAYELAEQLSAEGVLKPSPNGNGARPGAPWRAPDWYVQAVSGGLGPAGTMKGFVELKEMGLIDKVPALACIQAEGCAPMATAFRRNLEAAEPVLSPRTHIATLATGSPGRAYQVLRRYIQTYGGIIDSVSDEDAYRALHVLAKMEGLSMEPAAAVAFAGLIQLVRRGVIGPDEVVVVNCSGHTFPIETSILGEGWSRDVELPSQEARETAGRPQEGLLAALQRLDQRVRSIAIVDDNPDAVRLISRILQARGDYDIVIAQDGQSGLSLIRERRPDLVVLDLMMPEMDGFAVIDALRADSQTQNIPIIVVTAKELTPDERSRLNGQIEALLQKGLFMDDELLEDVLGALT
jgi:threonine synthase